MPSLLKRRARKLRKTPLRISFSARTSDRQDEDKWRWMEVEEVTEEGTKKT